MQEMTFTLGDIIAIISVAVATASLMFGFMKWRDGGIHKRISKLEEKLDKEVDEIKDNYAQQVHLEQSLKSIETMFKDMKTEQHRMSQRMDEFMKWLMQLQSKENNRD